MKAMRNILPNAVAAGRARRALTCPPPRSRPPTRAALSSQSPAVQRTTVASYKGKVVIVQFC